MSNTCQYHCHPSAGDRVALIKEVSTCAYLMKIYTPRLCNDVAFLPPQDNLANHISCQPVLRQSEIDAWTLENAEFKARETERLITEAENNNPLRQMEEGLEGSTKRGPIIGGIEVGAQALVGSEGRVIEKGIMVGGGKTVNKGTILNSEGWHMSAAELKTLGISPEAFKSLKEQSKSQTTGEKWRIDLIETPRGDKHFMIVNLDEEEEEKQAKKASSGGKEAGAKDDKVDEKGRGMGKEEEKEQIKGKGQQQAGDGDEDESEEGSEEVYKDEL